MNSSLIQQLLDKQNVFAVVGASRNPKKYGHQVYRDLKEAGYVVYPINPNIEQILGDTCYPNLESLPVKPDVVDFVVPPKITDQILQICQNLGITNVWMQPGSESKRAIQFCNNNSIKVVHSVCVMIERRSQT